MLDRKEIKTRDDIKFLVDEFYHKVNLDPLLSPIFNNQIGSNWLSHLDTMYSFWATQLIGEGSYHGRPFPPHALLRIDARHFQRWLELFCETVDNNFLGLGAEMAKQKARNIAVVFQAKLNLIQN